MVLREYPLTKERTTIGRKPHNDIVIDNLAVSGEHAMIMTILNDSFLEDLGSTNGTLVNGQPIKKHFLQNNDVIELGKYKLKYMAEAVAAGGLGGLREDHGAAGGSGGGGPCPSARLAAKATRGVAAGRQEFRRHGGQPRADAEPEHRRQSARRGAPGLGHRRGSRGCRAPAAALHRGAAGRGGNCAPAPLPLRLRAGPTGGALRAAATPRCSPAQAGAPGGARARSRSCRVPAPARSCRCPSRSPRWASPGCRWR